MRPAFSTRRPVRWLAVLGLLLIGLPTTGLAQTTTTCAITHQKGVDGPVDYGAYCWIDFSNYNPSQATSAAGQPYKVNLPGGAYLTLTLKVTGSNLTPVTVPSWSGAAFGNSAFLDIPGQPVLYQGTDGTNSTVSLSNVQLHVNGSPDVPFVFVAADGESTNSGESLAFSTAGNPWQLADSPGQNSGRPFPTLTYSNGNRTVTETGQTTGKTGSYVFTTDNSPGTVTANLDGGGLQGALFGLKFHSIDLALTKSHTGNFKVGGNGSYQLVVTNNVNPPDQNPPTSPQPIRITDTLPAGLTYTSAGGTGWSCSASGQVVTCNTSATLSTQKTLSPVTLNVHVASSAPTSLTNTATVEDVTPGYVFDTNTTNNTASDPTTIMHSDLSTSTKTVVDLNGGDAEPGDVLEYTITLKESAGMAASNVHVSDDMPAHVGNLVIIDNAGGSDNSTPTGGANGTGKVDIPGISVAANDSKTIVYDVTIAGGTAPGTTIDNSASIDNPDPHGSGATPAAPTVTVSQSQVPASGNKILYVYDNGSLTRTPQTGSGSAVSISSGSSSSWALTPALQKPLVIKANSTISVKLMVRCSQTWTSNACWPYGTTWNATLYDNTVSAGTRIGTGSSPDASFNHAAYAQETANISIGGSSVTIAAGHKLILTITNDSTYQYALYTTMQVEQYAGGSRSTVSVNVSTVINVDSVKTYANANCTGSPVTPVYETKGKVYICAVVSDPFGSYDIDPATGGTAPTITIQDAGGAQQVNAADMTQVADSGAASKTFRYTYTLPTSPPATLALGHWTPSVTAWEGTEHSIHHTANGDFMVGAPDLVVVKSVSVVSDPVEGSNNPKALPGAKMRYGILITNQGNGAVDNNQLSVTDPIPDHTAFVVGSASGSGAGSGVANLTPGDVQYSNDNGSTWTYTPSAGGDGSDPAVTNIRFQPSGSMKGKTGSSAPSYGITFDVILQ
jgi:uncharacterized repeat protein (TIGR01451 family)